MNKKYYRALSDRLTKKGRQIEYFSSGEHRKKNYYDYFYYIGRNKTLSGIITMLIIRNIFSDDEIKNLNYCYSVAYHSTLPTNTNSMVPLYFSNEILDTKRRDTLVKSLITIKDTRIKKLEKGGMIGVEPGLFGLDNFHFLHRVHNLLKDELVELEFYSEKKDINESNKNSAKKNDSQQVLRYNYDDVNSMGILTFGDKKIIFSEERALIVGYFYSVREMDLDYKSYHNVNEYFLTMEKKINSPKLRQDVKRINERVKKESDGFIRQIIGMKDKQINSKETNFYRWDLKM